MKKNKEVKVLCYECSKPIHVDDLGGISKINGKEAWFHKNCLPIISNP